MNTLGWGLLGNTPNILANISVMLNTNPGGVKLGSDGGYAPQPLKKFSKCGNGTTASPVLDISGLGHAPAFCPSNRYVYMFPGVSPGEAATMICALSGALSEHADWGRVVPCQNPPTLMLNI